MRIPAAIVVLAALALPAGAVAAVPEKVAVRGRVTDEGGRGVAEVPVRLLQSRRDFLWTVGPLQVASAPASSRVAGSSGSL